MHWFLMAAGLVSIGSIASLSFAVGALALGKWSTARATALGAFFAGAVVFAIFAFTFALMFVVPGVMSLVLPLGEDTDPGDKARALAETISRMMNIAALGAVAVLPSGMVWWIARRKVLTRDRGAG
jgi:hypothetical protein